MLGPVPPLPQYVFMAWCLVKHKDNFTFNFFYLYVWLDVSTMMYDVKPYIYIFIEEIYSHWTWKSRELEGEVPFRDTDSSFQLRTGFECNRNLGLVRE
jgi:hypothetical protein